MTKYKFVNGIFGIFSNYPGINYDVIPLTVDSSKVICHNVNNVVTFMIDSIMNKLEFDKVFENLTRRQKEVLQAILSGKTDKAIAESKKITEVAVRKHVQRICEAFSLKKIPGKQYSQRPVLINLFAKYKPELVDSELRSMEIENREQQYLTPLYVERPNVENNCYEEIQKAGSLLRIKAPKHMGQTWLKDRIIKYSQEKLGYKTVSLSFKLADRNILSDLNKFCRWFCAVVTNQLKLDNKPDINRLDNYWNDLFGCNYNTTIYFQDYLLTDIISPLVLALDDVDLVFERPEIASDFCALLRGWNDLARRGNRNSGIWQKLRLILVHSTDIYGLMDINSSPLANVGRVIDLPEFTPEEVKDLADSYKLDWSDAQVNKLMDVVGGHPYLVQLALNYINKHSDLILEKLLQEASTETGIYGNYLHRHLGELEKDPKLLETLKKEVASNKSDRLKLKPVELVNLVQKNPSLRKSIFDLIKIKHPNLVLEKLLQEASTETGIYSNYLRQYLGKLEENPKLATAFQEVIKGDSVQLDPMQAFKLHSMGLVELEGNNVKPNCKLYFDYFKLNLVVSKLESKGKQELQKSCVVNE